MDIVERLREFESVKDYWGDWEIAKEAADEIERLREALKLERQLQDDALRAFNEAQAALEESE